MIYRLLAFGFFCSVLLGAQDLSQKAYQILQENCFACHGAAMQMSGLDLRTRESLLSGGERGAAVVPTSLKLSPLYQFAAHLQKPHMPPGQKLSDDEVEILRRWIVAGAPLEAVDPAEQDRKAQLAKLEERPISEEERQFWAFQPPVRREPPAVNDAELRKQGWGENPIDAFLLAAMSEKGVRPSPPADKRTLIRRAYLDLIGLPPSPEEVEAFVNDRSPGAFEKLVERLLESPHYGERWGRHWLDLVHYADSGGYERDFDWPTMWRYRDYVVAAFNNDKPYDQFIREQLAGDEIAPESHQANVATGYLRLIMDNNIKDERTRMDELDDYIATTGLTFLGLTTGCARCHNHKFDPIPQKDYYRMQAVFFSTKETDYPLVPDDVVEAHQAAEAAIDKQQEPLKARLKEIEEPHREQVFQEKLSRLPEYYQIAWRTPAGERTEGQRLNARQVEAMREQITEKDILGRFSDTDKTQHETVKDEIAALDKKRPEPFPTARTITEEGREAWPSYFLHRGNPGTKGSLMQPGVLSVATREDIAFPEPPPTAHTSWRRKHFADWIASNDNPLTARVTVNRIWQHHFGEGMVRTPSNFGTTGQPPSHPELLDWLALEFIEQGWSAKKMHRLMLTSRAYQMASDDIDANLKVDAENRLVWRMARQRLEAEAMRDSILAVAGTLDRTTGGPAVRPYINPDLFQSSTSRTWPGKPIGDRSTWRRSLYVFSKRSIRYPMFEAFDQPDMVTSCARRNRSTVSPQALLLMNNAEVMLQARFFAQRVAQEAGPDPEARVNRAYEIALGRPPRGSETKAALEFLDNNPHGLVDFCQTLFNLNEFVYRQ